MSRQYGRCYCIVILAVGFLTAAAHCIGDAFGSEMQATLSAPTIENVDGGRNYGLQPKQAGAGDAQLPAAGGGPPETDLMLVTWQSCRVSVGNTPLSAIPMFGGADREGEWVLLAGVGWNKDRGFGAKGPVLIETREGREPANWYFTVEMLFLPEGRWNVRASLAIDGEELHDAIAASDPQLNPLHIGVAIAFDHGDNNPLVINLGYGHLPLEGRILPIQPDDGPPDHVLAETRIFSACLNIQW